MCAPPPAAVVEKPTPSGASTKSTCALSLHAAGLRTSEPSLFMSNGPSSPKFARSPLHPGPPDDHTRSGGDDDDDDDDDDEEDDDDDDDALFGDLSSGLSLDGQYGENHPKSVPK